MIAFGTLWATIPSVYLYAIGWMLLDLDTGLAKAYSIGPNRSTAGKDAAPKVVIYLGMLALADYASHSWVLVADAIVPIPVSGVFLGGVLLLLARGLPYIASGLITHSELVSILENLQAIAAHQGKQYRALDLFARIVRVIGSVGKCRSAAGGADVPRKRRSGACPTRRRRPDYAGILAMDYQLLRLDAFPLSRPALGVDLELGVDMADSAQVGSVGLAAGSKAFAGGYTWSRWDLGAQGLAGGVGLRF